MKEICNLLFELGHLRRIKHEGWRLTGFEEPESVADHSLRAAQIGFILSKLENYPDPHQVSTMLVFHDMAESRIGDLHRVAQRYIQVDEQRVVQDQVKPLKNIGLDLLNIWKKFEYPQDKAGILAKDADLLEMALTAREYYKKGYQSTQDWINTISTSLKTHSAKKLLSCIIETDPVTWWEELKKKPGGKK
jgi:putative hydrolase of HD superfamily